MEEEVVGSPIFNFHTSSAAKKYPFYAVQWHPEKSGFEWNTRESINHSQLAVRAMQMATNFFVNEGWSQSGRS